VRSALLKVPGVTRAQVNLVNLKGGEALVTYNPRLATVDAIVNAVNQADGPVSPRQYTAQVTGSPRPDTASDKSAS
jgi:copper chaperone CopZ